MEALKTFKPDKIKAISLTEKVYSSGFEPHERIYYTSIKFEYNGGEMPAIRIDGNFRLFRFKKKRGDTYSLSINCDSSNENFFREICKTISKETCKIVCKSVLAHESTDAAYPCKQEDFELVKKNKHCNSVYTK